MPRRIGPARQGVRRPRLPASDRGQITYDPLSGPSLKKFEP